VALERASPERRAKAPRSGDATRSDHGPEFSTRRPRDASSDLRQRTLNLKPPLPRQPDLDPVKTFPVAEAAKYGQPVDLNPPLPRQLDLNPVTVPLSGWDR
jgi:hypothetical protein